jgi:hypothetical protein
MSQNVKIVITAPLDNADAVRRAMGDAGAGKFGNYSHCSFSSRGTGRFLPKEGANPTIGSIGEIEAVDEERIEVLCDRSTARAVIEAAITVHVYEEPMYEIYPVLALDEL